MNDCSICFGLQDMQDTIYMFYLELLFCMLNLIQSLFGEFVITIVTVSIREWMASLCWFCMQLTNCWINIRWYLLIVSLFEEYIFHNTYNQRCLILKYMHCIGKKIKSSLVEFSIFKFKHLCLQKKI